LTLLLALVFVTLQTSAEEPILLLVFLHGITMFRVMYARA